jgi:hypothetical protein
MKTNKKMYMGGGMSPTYAKGGKPTMASKQTAVRDNTSTGSQYKSAPAVSKSQAEEMRLKTKYVLADAAARKSKKSYDDFKKEGSGYVGAGEKAKYIEADKKKNQAELRLNDYQRKMK